MTRDYFEEFWEFDAESRTPVEEIRHHYIDWLTQKGGRKMPDGKAFISKTMFNKLARNYIGPAYSTSRNEDGKKISYQAFHAKRKENKILI